MRQCIHTWSNNMYMNVFLCNHVDDWNPVLIKGTSFWGEIPPMISASSKGLTLVVCPVVKFVMVSSSTTKQPEKQRFFHLTHLTPQKNAQKETQEFLLISFFWSKRNSRRFSCKIYEQISTEVFPPTFVDSERRYFSLSKLSTNPWRLTWNPKKLVVL